MKKAVKKRNKANLIIPIFVALLILLFALLLLIFPKLILLAPGELSVDRNLPESAQINQQFTVTLNVYTATDKPAAIGIIETFPAGWAIGNIQGTDYQKITDNNIELLLFSLTNNIGDITITYTITPTNTQADFSGNWESVDPDSSGNIGGDTTLTINTGSGGGGETGGGGSGGSEGGGGGTTTSTQPRICQENWLCTDWIECTGEIQTRTCTDTSACGTSTTKPIEQASCNPVIKTTQEAVDYSFRHSTQTILILLIAIAIIIITMVLTMRKKRRK